MKTTRIVNIDACRNELALAILQTHDIEVLNKVRRAYRRATAAAAPFAPIPGVPSTLEEVKQDIAEFEAELDAGTPGYMPEEFEDRMKQKHPWLCK